MLSTTNTSITKQQQQQQQHKKRKKPIRPIVTIIMLAKLSKQMNLIFVGIGAIQIIFLVQIYLFSQIPMPNNLAAVLLMKPNEWIDPAAIERRKRFRAKLEQKRRTTSLMLPDGRTEQYKCVAFRSTRDCNPYGGKLYRFFGMFGDRDLPCDSFVPDHAGYCELQHIISMSDSDSDGTAGNNKGNGEHKRAFLKGCKRPLLSGETPQAPYMTCQMAVSFLNYKYEAITYEPNPPLLLARAEDAHQWLEQNIEENNIDDEEEKQQSAQKQQLHIQEGFLDQMVSAFKAYVPLLQHHHEIMSDQQQQQVINRGIVLQVYDEVVAAVYAIIRVLRDVHDCQLPIELWCLKGEDDLNDPILKRILRRPHIHLRVIDDPEVESYMSKPYSIAYSNFEELLFLDSDNFPLRNPEYLFDTTEFQDTGAIFWKDFWAPSRDEFYITQNSVLWEMLGIRSTSPIKTEMEMESGQILVNRRKTEAALKVLLYFSKTFKEWFEPLGLVLGDKDLFRLAWHLSETPFHYIVQPPGTAGFAETPETISNNGGRYSVCGLTMVQHDTEGEMIFFHRNAVKVTEPIGAVPMWQKGQVFIGNTDPELYQIDQTMGWHHLDGRMCYHPHADAAAYFKEVNFRGTQVEWLEKTVIAFAKEAELFQTQSQQVDDNDVDVPVNKNDGNDGEDTTEEQ